jgi:hypothetical protein
MLHNILTSMSISAAGASVQSNESAQSRADLSSPLESEKNIRTTNIMAFSIHSNFFSLQSEMLSTVYPLSIEVVLWKIGCLFHEVWDTTDYTE